MAEYQRCPCGFPKSVCWRCTPVVDFPEKVALKGEPSPSDTFRRSYAQDPEKVPENAVNTQSSLTNHGDRAGNPWLASLSPRAREHYEADGAGEPSAGPVPPLWTMLAVAGSGWLIGFLAGWLLG